MGCLTAPFKLLALLLFIALLGLGWLYRDRLGDMGKAAWREATGKPAAVVDTGLPSAEALATAQRKIELLGGREDSVVLTAAETASLFQRGLEPYSRAFFDSMQVRLGEGTIGITTIVRTDRLPAGLLGPFGGALREREPVSADGVVRVQQPGRGVWEVRRLQFRDIPLPRDAIPRLLGRATGDSARSEVPLALPARVGALRVRPDGVTLYREGR